MEKRTGRIIFWAGMLLGFAGLDVLLLVSHTSRLLGFALLLAGVALVFASGHGGDETRFNGLSRRLLFASLGKRTPQWLFPLTGAYLMVFVIAFNLYFRHSLDLGSHDTVTLLFGAVLAGYPFVPERFQRHYHFALVFSATLFLVLVVPLTLYSVFSSGNDAPNSPFIYHLLARPVAGLLSAVGVSATALAADSGVRIDYVTEWSTTESVIIGISCTGLYSVSIFISALLAYTLTEKERFTIRLFTIMAAGVFLSWVANILRMSTIVYVGHRYGSDALYWTHENLGLLIFVAWMVPFWFFMMRFIDTEAEKSDGAVPSGRGGERRTVSCQVCGGPLTHVDTSVRCRCGSMFHKGCVEGFCPECGIALPVNIK